MSTKEEIKDQIADFLELDPAENPPMSTGSTEPRRIFELIDEKFELSLDPDNRLTKPQLAKAIATTSGQEWHAGCESRGGTVTKIGFRKVLYAVSYLKQRAANGEGPFTPNQLGIANDYVALRTRNTGTAYEYAIAALLMPPRQLEEFRDVTIVGLTDTVRTTIDQISAEINPSPINTHCLIGLPQTDDHRYVQCAFQFDGVGPSDIVVHDCRAPDVKVGISIKHKNNNIKNISPIGGLGMDQEFMDRQHPELRRITPDWLSEMTRNHGYLQYPLRGKHTWWRKQSRVTADYYDRVGAEVMAVFNEHSIDERVRLTRSLFHLNDNPLRNFFILKTNEGRCGYFIETIIRQYDDNFAIEDPVMVRTPDARVKKRIIDDSGIDPIGIDIQVKCNNGFAEHKKRNGDRYSQEDVAANPDECFSVAAGAETHALKYGSLNSWDVTVGVRPSQNFWEYVYES